MNREQYNSDSRYRKVLEQMDLLGIMDVTTTRQHKNGTIVWKLPIKNNWTNGKLIEVASFSTGYVRNQNSCYSNYQLNKRGESEPQYYKLSNGDFREYTTRTCKLIPNEIDRLEYLIGYCLKNYYIKKANEVINGKYISKWEHEYKLERVNKPFEVNALQNKLANSVTRWQYDEAIKLGREKDEEIIDLKSRLDLIRISLDNIIK